MKTVACASC